MKDTELMRAERDAARAAHAEAVDEAGIERALKEFIGPTWPYGSDSYQSMVRDLMRSALIAALSPATQSGDADPDIGKVGPDHVCKHGIRWPHACEPCADSAWQAHKAQSSDAGKEAVK